METYRDNSKAAGAQRRQSVSSRSGSAHGTSRARRSAQGGAAVRDSSGSGAARAADRLRSNGRGRAVNEGGRSVSTRRATGSRRHRSNFMRYAADNRVVQTIYAITTGPWRFAFYGVVAAAIALSVYFPVRDLYAAYRTGDILERQLAVRESYNKTLETEVNKLQRRRRMRRCRAPEPWARDARRARGRGHRARGRGGWLIVRWGIGRFQRKRRCVRRFSRSVERCLWRRG